MPATAVISGAVHHRVLLPRPRRSNLPGSPADRWFAGLNQKWHERARTRHPEWPAVPGEAYLALVGATAELVRSLVSTGQTNALPSLEETIVSLHLAVLADRPWTA